MKLSFFVFVYFCVSTSVYAESNYQKMIEKSYPGFVILKTTEFKSEFIQSKEPGLIIGKFNDDQLLDFAAMIRAKEKKRYGTGPTSYEYFDGKIVVCHAEKKSDYKCQLISEAPISIPQESYLALVKPQKTNCFDDNGKKKFVNVKTDAIGWYYPEKGGSHYFHKKDGTYENCVTSD